MNIIRKPLLTAELGESTFTRAEIKEVTLQPGQASGPHFHPCPVISYVAKGSIVFQIEGQAEQQIAAGQVIYEPAGMPILKFDNASQDKPVVFIACYLLKGEQELIKML